MGIDTLRKISAAAKEWGCGPNNSYQIKVREVEAALKEYGDLYTTVNRIAAQVGHPPIALGELGIESVAEAVERRMAYAQEREEALDSITPESLQAFAASEAHHDEHHKREAELEAQAKRDAERLNYILRKAGEDSYFNVSNILGDYEGDDEEEYYRSAREAIDSAMHTEKGNLQVWKVNDCDWYAAISFDEAVEYAIANGADKECIFTYGPALGGPLPLSEEELREMKIGDADDGPNGEKISGWERLQQLRAADVTAIFFASTEW